MKKLCAKFAGLAALFLLMPYAWAAPGDGISGTAHDFSGISSPQTGACTFCHTPHQAQAQALLWNHTLSTNNFSWLETTTTGGTPYSTFAGDTYKGPTAKCLSCHDGSVAIGDIGWWNGGAPGAPLLNSFITGGFQIGEGGDMTGNHPVAMPFPYGSAANTYNSVTNGASALLSGWQPTPEANGIKLYTDDGTSVFAGVTPGQTGMECTSCHDPHNGSEVQDIFFLRGLLGGNTADYICVKCHDKG